MDYYGILGVAKTATPDEIKKAYRKLASQHHPDKGGDKVKFQEIQSAYDVLSNSDKRQQYDNPARHNQHQNFGFTTDNVNINDIFNTIFRHQHGTQHFSRQLYRTQIDISLQDAYNGTNKMLELNLNSGKKVIDITVPKGVNQGDQLRFDNIIENGSLMVNFNIMPDLRFERRQNDLYCNHSISVLDLIAGTDFIYKTISGKELNISIKPKTQPYVNVRLVGYGMPIVNTSSFGDQYILLKPYIPDKIDDSIIDSILRSRTL